MSRIERVLLWSAFALLAIVVAGGAANHVTGIGGATLDSLMRTWAASFVYVCAAAIVIFRAIRIPSGRAAWTLIAVGLTLYAAGNVVWVAWYDGLESPPIPSISDGLWLALYPASYLGLLLLARERGRTVPAGVWLDGIVAGLGLAAIGAAVVFGPVLDSATGSPIAVATNLAYPVADLLLASLVIGLLALRGWRPDRCWALLGAGFMLLCVADSIYLLQVAAGSAQTSLLPNIFYLSGVVLLALAAWQPQREASPAQIEGWSVLLVPAAFVIAAIGMPLYDHYASISELAIVLATLTLLAAMVRTALTFRDVRALAQTRREATTDDLTSLPNRRLFLRTVDDAIAAARADGGSIALLLVDLDQFKKLNDGLGHQAGDELLRQIGPRVSEVLREHDMLARLGGDEFGVMLSSPCDEAAALSVADRVGAVLREPFDVAGLHLRVAASVGISLYPSQSEDAQQLLRHADIAMYEAKVAGSARELYARERDTNSRESLALASELPGAIAGGQLVVHYQAVADASTRRIVGMEALVRWEHPERGLLAPAAFVPLAEQTGLMRELTRTVIADAAATCRRWREAGHDVHVAVNVSFTDLLDTRFPFEVADTLVANDLDPAALVIEVTESSIMSDAERIGDVLARLGEFGVHISLDDFGTGYSSLAHLRALPVGEVKVDRSFVARMHEDATDKAIVRSTVQLAHNLGMRVVAEGVEDDQTWTSLASMGCDRIQGYGLSRPLPAADAEALIEANAAASQHRLRSLGA